MLSANKKRAKNLSQAEKDLIMNIVLKYKDIVENKKTDNISLEKKNSSWQTIANEFNSQSEIKRDTDQLKIYYKNAKSKLKKQLAENKIELYKTGGGTNLSKFDDNNPLLSIVLKETTPISNPFDSSAEYNNEYVTQVSDTEIFTDAEDDFLQNENASNSTLSTQCVNDTPTTSTIRKKKRSNEEVKSFIEDLAALKKKKLEAEIEKNKAKTAVYEKKLKILDKIEKGEI